MSDGQNFTKELESALTAKTEWFNTSSLPEMLDNYRLLHTCVKNLYELLVQRSLIKPDPYKLDKKISEITVPDSSPFIENERATVMGARFSDYESMLDFICTYFKFSVDHIDISQIRRLVDLNNCIDWKNLSANNSKTNTRSLAELIAETRNNVPQMTLSLINDSINKSAQAIAAINALLKELTDFQREVYKGQLRKDLFEHPSFNKSLAFKSPLDEISEIKRLYPEVMGKKPFYNDLIQEIVREDQAPNKQQLQQTILQKLEVKEQRSKTSKKKVNTKEMLLETVLVISALGPQIDAVIAKIQANHDIITNEHNSFFDKLRKTLRRAFNIPEPKEEYDLVIINQKTDAKSIQTIEYNTFLTNLERKERFFLSFSGKQTTEYRKIESSTEESILDFVNKQISDTQEILILLNALDDYFKANSETINKDKIKGMKIELVTMKNSLVKANQKRAEYTSFIEEENQMKKLGIKDVD
ncbi:MAG: hypothetical protein WCR31_09005 [Treponema sp.]